MRQTPPVARSPISAGFSPKRSGARSTRRIVAVVAFDGGVLGDLATACELFARARLPDGAAPYDVRVCGVSPAVRTTHATLRPPCRLATLRHAHTVIVPGVDDVDRP